CARFCLLSYWCFDVW
nr:immunoglobulin heavy chain junction region [Mus musculus]MBK4184469.1 immunoglobulin heavy chain junction region [Mus musculus]MBK4184471.1 immunoglobulin heavy chain junction region [Mus musculus]